jgi:signal transduction histidine kinase
MLNNVNDTVRLDAYCQLQFYFLEINRDSSLYYGKHAGELAVKLNQKYSEAHTLMMKGYALNFKGDYPNSLTVLLQASALAEDPDIGKNILTTNFLKPFIHENPEINRFILLGYLKNNLGLLYGNTRNTPKQFAEYFEAKKFAERAGADKFLIAGIYSNIATAYLDINNLDSALAFEKLAIEADKSHDVDLYSAISFAGIGDIYLRKGVIDSAKKNLFEALRIIPDQDMDNRTLLAYTYTTLANLYTKTGKIDSALLFAKQGLASYRSLGDPGEILNAYNALALIYEEKKLNDSAFYYLHLAKNISDSLNEVEIENLSRFQNIGFENQLKLQELEAERISNRNKIRTYALLAGLAVFLVIAIMLYRNNKQKQKTNALLKQQKEKVESTLTELKSTQAQLIQSEKMASLGELTAGIAHEIQNPLNFVNNFSEVNEELLTEMKDEMSKGKIDDALALADDAIENQKKINHHGKRADAIVKGMLQHSRSNSGVKEPTNINALADEYLRLAYHGLRAKDKSFNATLKTDYDESIGNINIIPQDIGRVMLNLITNAFYAVTEKNASILRQAQNSAGQPYEPTVSISTKKINNKVEVRVKDNGNGIPQKVLDKIFQPFFTTKPTGQGTGLGLSLAYDIIKALGGELKVETKEGEGAEFTIKLLNR